jgi:hypothetical protein
MKQLHRIALYALLACTLNSCASDGDYRTSLSVNGAPAPGMSFRDPRFYMNEREMAPILTNPNFPFRPADADCNPVCGPGH